MRVKTQFYILIAVVAALLAYGIAHFALNGDVRENAEPVQSLPAITFYDAEGRATKLTDFNGKVVLVNLWATWCTPCVGELPSLDRLQAKLGDKGFQVVALSIEPDLPKVKAFLKAHGVEHLSAYVDKDREVPSKWTYAGVPTSYLLGPDGQLLHTFNGPAEWDKGDALAQVTAAVK
ncbi:MAG: TlpA disulfide reductase family protein [Micavibrio sp.]|nr:TlpA disulfide reductase family protein [Micavibrio sp.]